MQIFTYKYGYSYPSDITDFSFISLLCWHCFFLRSELLFCMSYVVLFSHSSTFLPLSFLLYFTCLYFFIPACILSVLSLFALFLIFWTDLLNFSPFIYFLCSFDNKPHFFPESLHYFLLLPFFLIPCIFFPTCIFYFLFSVPSLPLQSWWYWKILQRHIYGSFSCWWWY